MTFPRAFLAFGLVVSILAASPSAQQKPAPQQPTAAQSPAAPAAKVPAQPREIPRENLLKAWKGGFDVMLERRLVRVPAAPSRTFFFNELGRERGCADDIVRAIEQQLNPTGSEDYTCG